MVTGFQGAIIAAGRGDRLRASSGTQIPKPLIQIGGVPLLLRQANAMLSAGASTVVAVVNSETGGLTGEISLPSALTIIVRDTESSMESLFALGEILHPGHFLLATVDAVVPALEFQRFVSEARRLAVSAESSRFDAVLAVTKWRGDRKPLFTNVTAEGLITSLGQRESPMVTAGIYWLPTTIFRFVAAARQQRLAALRSFLQMLVEQKTRLGALEVRDAIDIDEASDLEAARRMLAGQL